MPRRRDSTTRQIKAYERRMTERYGERYVAPVRGSRTQMKNFGDEMRARGRRGVRARARQARIMQRQATGTYRQPGGGSVSNSP